jgi:hypothetical protein
MLSAGQTGCRICGSAGSFCPSVDKNVLYNYNIKMMVFGEQAVGRVDLLAGSE